MYTSAAEAIGGFFSPALDQLVAVETSEVLFPSETTATSVTPDESSAVDDGPSCPSQWVYALVTDSISSRSQSQEAAKNVIPHRSRWLEESRRGSVDGVDLRSKVDRLERVSSNADDQFCPTIKCIQSYLLSNSWIGLWKFGNKQVSVRFLEENDVTRGKL